MAVTITNIFQGVDASVNDIQATADADAAAIIPHGLGSVPFVPTEVTFMPRVAVPKTVGVTALDGTNITCAMGVAAGSGQAGPQLRVLCKRPHTIGR